MKRLASILTIVFLYILALEVAVFSSSVQAQTGTHVHEVHTAPDRSFKESFKEIWTRDKLTGDWGGLRTDLHDHGIDIDLRLSQYYQNVACGGVNQNGEYGGTMDYRVNADGKKLFGLWDGLSFNMHARTRFGQDVNADAGAFALENAGMLMPLPGGFHGTEITGLTVSQYLPFFGGLANVSFGKLNIVDTLTGLFPWIGYGQDGFWNPNGMFPLLPWIGPIQGLSLFGGVAMTVNEKYQMPQSGFIIAGTENVATTWNFSDSFKEGAFMAGFQRFFWGDPNDKIGHFTIVGFGSTREQASNDRNDIVRIPGQGIVDTDLKKPWGVSAFVYQEFWQAEGNPDRKANFVIGGSAGPDDPQIGQWTVFANIEAYGLMASRPADRVGVSGWYTSLSDNFKDLVSPVIALQDTWGAELYYNIAINKWLRLTPDLQLVMNERAADDIAVIPGVRLVMDF